MGIDWGSVASGAGTGAIAGSGIPGLGTALGGLIGGGSALLAGLFGGDTPSAPTYKNLQDPQISAMVQTLMNSKLGQQQAQRASAQIGNQTRTAQEQFAENPNFQGNAAVTAAFNNKVARTGEEAIAGANIQGAQVDQAAMEKAAQLQLANNQYSLQRNDFERGNYDRNQQPTFLQNLFGNSLTGAVGSVLGRGAATNPKQGLTFDPTKTNSTLGNTRGGMDWRSNFTGSVMDPNN